MADQTEQQLESIVQKMIASGSSQDEIAKFVQGFDDLQHPMKARVAGAIEGIAPGVISGIVALPQLAINTVLDTLSVLQGKSPEHAKAFLDSMTTLLPKLQAAEPREQGRMISELTTSLGV